MEASERNRVAREIYDRLSPEERRDRFALSATYRSAYNRALGSEDRMTLPRYFWRKWLPILGAQAAALYVVLRDISQVEAAGSDSWCWPEQKELGRRIGVSKNPLRASLAVLESHGFIRSERKRGRPEKGWGMVQVTNRYQVFLDIPLCPEDGVAALLEEMAACAGAPEFIFRTQGKRPVENPLSSTPEPSAPEFQSCTQGSGELQGLSDAEFRIRPLNVKNVTNVTNVGKVRFKDDPRVTALTPEERSERESLAYEIGETLSMMEGQFNPGAHKSLGLHRRFAFLMPTSLVREALTATRDASDNQRAGRLTITEGLSGYFAGTVFALADREGIDLGVNRRASRAAKGRNQGPLGPRVLVSSPAASRTVIESPAKAAEPANDAPISNDEVLRARSIIQELERKRDAIAPLATFAKNS